MALQVDVDKEAAYGIADGIGPNKLCTRLQCAAMVGRSLANKRRRRFQNGAAFVHFLA